MKAQLLPFFTKNPLKLLSLRPFVFKQFSVHQDQATMKVGTDAVLLGAWASIKNATTILDIGTGTGVISLMLAQRNEKATITAIEIEEKAYQQALFNFQNSKWASRFTMEHISFEDFQPTHSFDCIISNPPFFDNHHFSTNHKRTLARHTSSLSYECLIKKSARLLTKSGLFHVIIPFQSEEHFIQLAQKENLFPTTILRVRGRHHTPLKRSLLTFSFTTTSTQTNELVIEKSRHDYTVDYIDLTKDFYLKM